MFLVYVAGKFRGDISTNVAAAEAVGAALVASGAPVLPIVPHSIGQRYGALRPNADTTYWLPATLELMRRCHAVVTVPGWEGSEGARGEVEEARRNGIPVFHDVAGVVAWATRAPVPEEPRDPRHFPAESERSADGAVKGEGWTPTPADGGMWRWPRGLGVHLSAWSDGRWNIIRHDGGAAIGMGYVANIEMAQAVADAAYERWKAAQIPTHADIDAHPYPERMARAVFGEPWRLPLLYGMPVGYYEMGPPRCEGGPLAVALEGAGWGVYSGSGEDAAPIAKGNNGGCAAASRAALHAYLDNKLTPPKHAPGWAAWDWEKR